ncbi:MAG: hypothetical protein KAS72_12535 [Phycisphaerales bacterium]|nr:hypothetical protein [Phycisphaerales bacterium]
MPSDQPTQPPDDPQPADMDHAIAMYRGTVQGVLLFDESVMNLKYIIAADGHIVAPLMVAALGAMNTVIFAPEESDDALQLLVTPEQLGAMDFESPDTDRWRVYHGEPEDVRWAKLWVESAKLGPVVFDGDSLTAPNPLADAEPALCAKMNSDPALLRSLGKVGAGVEIAQPVMVGVDPYGIDIRARFGIVRIPFPTIIEAAEQVEPVVTSMLS